MAVPKIEYAYESVGELIETESIENNDDEVMNYIKPPPNRKRRIMVDNERSDPLIQQNTEFIEQPVEREESTNMFGKYLVQKLSQFDRKTKSILIYKINQLIFETEMELYTNYAPSPASISSPAPQSRSFAMMPTISSRHINSENDRDIIEEETIDNSSS